MARALNSTDVQLLVALDDSDLLELILDRAHHKIFKRWLDADAKDRWEIGHTADALKAITVEIQATVNEAHRNGRIEQTDAA